MMTNVVKKPDPMACKTNNEPKLGYMMTNVVKKSNLIACKTYIGR